MMHIDGMLLPNKNINITKDEYNITIDNIDYTIPITKLYEFMTMDDESFRKLCTDKKILNFYNIPKEHFAYACVNYMSEKKNNDRRFATPQVCQRYKILLHYELIDFEATNKDLEIIDKVYNKIELDHKVKELIVKDIPSNLTPLEKAIYIYIRMCQTFTYDGEFFSQNQSYKKELSYISTISLNNLELTCFEFSVIYGKLLAEIGINFRSYYGAKQRIYELRDFMDDGELSYGQKHAFTEFRTGKFLVDADAMESIIEGDLFTSKMLLPINGIQCLNSNRETQEEFQASLTKVYNIIKQSTTLNDTSESYVEKLKKLSPLDRLAFLQNKIKELNLKGLDAYSYIINMKRKLFTKEELSSTITIRIIRNNDPEDSNKSSDVLMVVTIIDVDNEYYLLTNSNNIIPITYKELESRFIDGTYEYIKSTDELIPNITIDSKKFQKTFKKK